MGKILNLRNKTAQQSRKLPEKEQAVEEKISISWEAPSFYYNPQKRYLSLLIVALIAGAAALMVFRRDTLTAIFLLLSSFVLILYGGQKPNLSKITADQSGVAIDDMKHLYRDLKSFWINYTPGGTKELSLESVKWYMPYIKVIITNQSPVELRSLLINFLPEKEHDNSVLDHIGRKIGL